ncbi:hypothetical protein VB735_12185 [Halotia wernerae UHCC 0503]|nr:hypothetical protein [Halotia wernerae UHCC 0503]
MQNTSFPGELVRAGGEGVAVLAVPVDCELPNPKGLCLCSRDFQSLEK